MKVLPKRPRWLLLTIIIGVVLFHLLQWAYGRDGAVSIAAAMFLAYSMYHGWDVEEQG